MEEVYKNKNVLVTGHTGFKGSWLIAWLKQLGANVTGVSLDPPTTPNHFQAAAISEGIIDLRIDIRNLEKMKEAIGNSSPDFVFHLAAQPLVGESFANPRETWNTNLIGTINVLEALRELDKTCSAVIITSDKCYDNVEWEWGYRENDRLGGPDPYSASKGAAEIAIKSYFRSFFCNSESKIRISSARAGNVIGGGDWADHRIIPDCVKKWSNHKSVFLRNPKSTRPWQHVLEPLGGYLILGAKLSANINLNGHSFNFGPRSNQNQSVLELVKEMETFWPQVKWEAQGVSSSKFYESSLLKLNCDKALHYLNWSSILDFKETVEMTATWYKEYYDRPETVSAITEKQIRQYSKKIMNLV